MQQGYRPPPPPDNQQNYQPYPQGNQPGYPQPGYPQNQQPYQQQQYQQQPQRRRATPQVKSRRSLVLLLAAVIGLIFSIVLVTGTFGQANKVMSATANTAEDAGRQLGAAIGTALMMPQMIASAVATLLAFLGWGTSLRGFALAAGIVFIVAAVLMIINALFLLPSTILSFVAYSRMKKYA